MTQSKSRGWLVVAHQGFKPTPSIMEVLASTPAPHEHFKIHFQISMDQKEGFFARDGSLVTEKSLNLDGSFGSSLQTGQKTPNNDSTM